MKNPFKEYKRLKEENKFLKRDIENLMCQVDNMMKFSSSFREYYDQIQKPVFFVGSKGVQTLTQTYTLNPYDNAPIDYIKQNMSRDLSKSLTNYIDFDLVDDPMGHRVMVAKLSILSKEVQPE